MNLQSIISLLKSLFPKFNPVLYTFLSPLSSSAHISSKNLYVGGMGFSNVGEMDGYMQQWWEGKNTCVISSQNVCHRTWIVIAHGKWCSFHPNFFVMLVFIFTYTSQNG